MSTARERVEVLLKKYQFRRDEETTQLCKALLVALETLEDLDTLCDTESLKTETDCGEEEWWTPIQPLRHAIEDMYEKINQIILGEK